MSKIGHGYGSEWHLLRYLGYHRNGLNRAVLDAIKKADGTDGGTINWQDSLFSAKRQALHDDCEAGGIEFIWDSDVTKLWNQYWPVRGTSPQWDAVGKLVNEGPEDWLLVEAKAHLGEMESPWHAKNAESQAMIRSAMAETAKIVTRGGRPHRRLAEQVLPVCQPPGRPELSRPNLHIAHTRAAHFHLLLWRSDGLLRVPTDSRRVGGPSPFRSFRDGH